MNKYIDAEKLIAEIERRKDVHRKNYEEFKDERFINDECEDDRILALITSLQQEQPYGYNRAMLEVKAKVDKLYDETSIGLSEYASGLYNGIAETCMKLRGFINARISSQEQPEAEFEKEYKSYMKSRKDDLSGNAVTVNMKDLARHFWNKGLNARKEE